MYTHVCINIYNCTYIYVYIYIYTCIYAYIYEYIYEYTCIHINIHTYSQSCPLRNTTIKKHILTFRANAGLFCKAYVYVVIYCVYVYIKLHIYTYEYMNTFKKYQYIF